MNFKKTQIKNMLLAIIIFIFISIFFHAFRLPSDYAVESDISMAIDGTGYYSIKRIFPLATSVCFFNSYATPEQLTHDISNIGVLELKMKVNDFTGVGDHVWWIVGIKSSEVVGMVRMSGKLRLKIRTVECVNTARSQLKFLQSNKYSTFVEINSKE